MQEVPLHSAIVPRRRRVTVQLELVREIVEGEPVVFAVEVDVDSHLDVPHLEEKKRRMSMKYFHRGLEKPFRALLHVTCNVRQHPFSISRMSLAGDQWLLTFSYILRLYHTDLLKSKTSKRVLPVGLIALR